MKIAEMREFKEYIDENWKFDGLSAKCLYGVHSNNIQPKYYPLDPDDLCRCMQALRFMYGEGTQEKWNLIGKTAKHYNCEVWERFYQNWIKLIDLFETEWNNDSAPKTYYFMKQIIYNEVVTKSTDELKETKT